jgi:predicted RNA-binding Zn ribbon-like protein
LRRALDLREALYVIGVEVAAGGPAPAMEVDRLAKEHAACVARARLTLDGGRYVWSWTPREAAIEAVLGPIALSALATLGQADLTRVKRCEGEKCGWLFFDTTKNKSRRWCEMEVCGNRAKQKRHGARARSAI